MLSRVQTIALEGITQCFPGHNSMHLQAESNATFPKESTAIRRQVMKKQAKRLFYCVFLLTL
jgi:hypothetical protein